MALMAVLNFQSSSAKDTQGSEKAKTPHANHWIDFVDFDELSIFN
jgi:hypothetical protein